MPLPKRGNRPPTAASPYEFSKRRRILSRRKSRLRRWGRIGAIVTIFLVVAAAVLVALGVLVTQVLHSERDPHRHEHETKRFGGHSEFH